MSTAELEPPLPEGAPLPELGVVATATGLAVAGEVDLTTWAALEEALRAAAERVPPDCDVVVELDELTFIDAHGVQLFARAARQLSPPRWLVLRGAPRMLERIAEVLRLGQEQGLVIEGRQRHRPP